MKYIRDLQEAETLKVEDIGKASMKAKGIKEKNKLRKGEKDDKLTKSGNKPG